VVVWKLTITNSIMINNSNTLLINTLIVMMDNYYKPVSINYSKRIISWDWKYRHWQHPDSCLCISRQ